MRGNLFPWIYLRNILLGQKSLQPEATLIYEIYFVSNKKNYLLFSQRKQTKARGFFFVQSSVLHRTRMKNNSVPLKWWLGVLFKGSVLCFCLYEHFFMLCFTVDKPLFKWISAMNPGSGEGNTMMHGNLQGSASTIYAPFSIILCY